MIRVLSYGAVAVFCGWAGYSYHAMVGRRGTIPVDFTVAETVPAAKPKEEEATVTEAAWEGSTTRAPWDPKGCQTIVFFHVPKTGGESVNQLWVDMQGRPRVAWWKNGYTKTSLRITGLEPKKQEGFLKSM